MIKNVIFDLGNVVLKLKWNVVIDKYAKTDEDKNLLEDVIFNSEEWKQLDNGTINKSDAINIMLGKLPERLSEPCKNIMKTWQDGLIINYEIIDFIDSIRKQGYNTYILSNAPLDIPDFLRVNDLEKYFDGQIISAEEKVSKPDEKIYKLIVNRFSLIPSECLFLDDKKENIEAAKALGINGYIFDYNNINALKDYIKDEYNIIV